MAQLPGGSRKLTGSKLLPREQITCQLTKEERETSLQIVQHPLLLAEEGVWLMSLDPETQ